MSFTNNTGTVEKGASVASVVLSWSFNKAMSAVTINGVSVDPASHTTTESGPFTGNMTWILAASDGTRTANASTSISFMQRRHWGASSLETLDDANIIGLGSSEFATNFNKAVSYDCTGGKYPYLAYPASFGAPSEFAWALIDRGIAYSGLIDTEFRPKYPRPIDIPQNLIPTYQAYVRNADASFNKVDALGWRQEDGEDQAKSATK